MKEGVVKKVKEELEKEVEKVKEEVGVKVGESEDISTWSLTAINKQGIEGAFLPPPASPCLPHPCLPACRTHASAACLTVPHPCQPASPFLPACLPYPCLPALPCRILPHPATSYLNFSDSHSVCYP